MSTHGASNGPTPPPDREPAATEPLPTIPEVTLLREIARGGMGVVYLGRQDFLERNVAVKLLSPNLNGDKFAARFRREAKILAGLEHPNIVSCYAAGVTTAGQYYLVMQLVDGPTLERWITANGQVAVPSALRITRQLASALGHACELGVIHRDIKTANILLEAPGDTLDAWFPFEPKLVDLGLARMIDGTTDLAQTAPGAIMGTPATMAPEQFDAPDTVDYRADVYGLGCVLYEMLTGVPAFTSSRLTDLVVQKRRRQSPNPCERSAHVPAKLGALVASMLAPEPTDRPATYRELIAHLDALATAKGDGKQLLQQLHDASKTPAPARAVEASSAGLPAGPGLLRTAEFEFLAGGMGGEAGKPAAAQFSSRVFPAPSAPAAEPAAAKPRAVDAASARVVGPRRAAGMRPLRTWLIAGSLAVAVGFAAVPLWPRATNSTALPAGPEPLAAVPCTPPPAPVDATRRPRDVQMLGLDGPLRRGARVLLKSQATNPGDDELRYAWSVRPATAASLSSPEHTTTALRHDGLPGDEFTVALAVGNANGVTTVERRVTVQYEPENLFADFLANDSRWQGPARLRNPWRQRDDGTVWTVADDLPAVRTRTLEGPVWRVAGKLLPERLELRRNGRDGFAQAAVCLRLAPRALALVCTREGPQGERWSLSLREFDRDDARGMVFEPLANAERTAITVDAPAASGGARYSITRRGGELVFEFGMPGHDERVQHRELMLADLDAVPLSLFARGGRVLFAELSLW